MSALAQRPPASKRLKYVVSLRCARVDGAQEDRPYIGLENIESATGRLIIEHRLNNAYDGDVLNYVGLH